MLFRLWLTGVIAGLFFGVAPVCFAQVDEIDEEVIIEEVFEPAIDEPIFEGPRPFPARGRIAVPVGPAPIADTEKPADPAEEPEEQLSPRPKTQLPPQFIVLKLQDGSTIAGDLSVKEISIETEFGELTVPIAKIRSFVPGLDSNPKAADELAAKIKDLESDDYKTREQARKDLLAMGPRISKQIAPHLESENAEVKRHVTEIMKEFEQQMEEAADDEEGASEAVKPLINLDTLETTEFTVTGRISPAEFKMASKYGPLTIALGDIVKASRPVDQRESLRRSISVPGQNLAQRSFKSTGLRVAAGDKVTITASGTITMSPWGSNASSGPDGMPNYGWYVPGSIPGGALVYRIGEKGQVQKAGTKTTFTAKTSGMLQLAVGMMPEYANEGYNFPGEFKAKVRVDPQ
jgi:hypothetical protein